MVPSISRRELLRGVGALGLSSLAGGACGVQIIAPPWPEGPAPEIVLTLEGNTSSLDWYADGLVLCSASAGATMWGSEEMIRQPDLRLLHVGAGGIDRVRSLLASDSFAQAAAGYHERGISGGLHLTIQGGGRAVEVGNDPPGLPSAVAELRELFLSMVERFHRAGFNAFHTREPHLLALYNGLTVFGNGVLHCSVASAEGPQLRFHQVPKEALDELRGALAELDRAEVPAFDRSPGGEGFSHVLAHGGKVPRIWVRRGHPVPAPLVPVVAALRDLRGQFAPVDDP